MCRKNGGKPRYSKRTDNVLLHEKLSQRIRMSCMQKQILDEGEEVIELIVIICLIWNTFVLFFNRQESHVMSGWSDYTTKLVHFRGEGKDAWGHSMLLIVPKVDIKEVIDQVSEAKTILKE